MRLRTPLVALLVAASSMAAPKAMAAGGADVVAACRDHGGPDCTGFDHLLRLPASQCRKLSGAHQCAAVDGRDIRGDNVAAHEKGWIARSLAMQRTLDDDEPLQNELWAHTHNSFNAEVYQPTFYGLDPNQIYSITDQLRMGVRAIEIDVHWAQSTSGDPAQNGFAVLVCHGGINRFPVEDHIGCGVNDPLFSTRMQELAAWVRSHPDEVVMLYLENQLTNNVVAHAQAAQIIKSTIGDYVYKPLTSVSTPCASLPMDTSRHAIRSSGARVIITGDCGPSGSDWQKWVFQRGARWKESGLKEGDDFDIARCEKDRAAEDYGNNWIRHWGDETGLSHAAQAGGDVTVNDARAMVRCGVNMIGLDNLVPFDERLAALVWSWAPDQPLFPHGCAYEGSDGYFRAGICARPLRAACLSTAGNWFITTKAERFDRAQRNCKKAAQGTFAVPRTGYANELLKRKKGTAEVWVNYSDTGSGYTPHG